MTGNSMVVLDIGSDVGALIVDVGARRDGLEIEICPAGQRDSRPDEGGTWWQGEWRGTHDHHHREVTGPAWPHVAVHRRTSARADRWAAVFPGLQAGDYELWLQGELLARASVLGGAVTEIEA